MNHDESRSLTDLMARVGVHALGVIIIYSYLCCHGPVQELLPWMHRSLLTWRAHHSELNQRELRNDEFSKIRHKIELNGFSGACD